jgi:hypothetical protein
MGSAKAKLWFVATLVKGNIEGMGAGRTAISRIGKGFLFRLARELQGHTRMEKSFDASRTCGQNVGKEPALSGKSRAIGWKATKQIKEI